MNTEYETALNKFRAAGAKFREAQAAYRNRTIGDDEFLAARAAFIEADKEFDVAEAAE